MIDLLLAYVLILTPPKPLQCYVQDTQPPYSCIVWYDPNTGKFYNAAGEEISSPLP
jgi:hypothetical protein